MPKAEVRSDGYEAHNIWRHSATVYDLYLRRARGDAEEMTCAAQAAELLAPYASVNDSVLDAGCGSGYFFHSLRKRGLDIQYHGIDATDSLINIGRKELPAFGLSQEQLTVLRIEDFQGHADHVICMNVLSNLDNFHKPLERLLKSARKTLILRESISDAPSYTYVRDEYLDDGVDLNVHVNTYGREEVFSFIRRYGFDVREEEDRRTRGEPELVIGYPHHWTFLVATKI